MATRRVGRGCGDESPAERRPPAKAEAASPPVLSLNHFCTKPFLCFGDVRLGASRTLSLALDNPNAEEAAVTLPRLPAADRGFSVWPRAFVLQVGRDGGSRRTPPLPCRHPPGRGAARGGNPQTRGLADTVRSSAHSGEALVPSPQEGRGR